MAEYQGNSKLQDLQHQVDEVKEIMASNIAKIEERGEKLEKLEQSTEALHDSAKKFDVIKVSENLDS